MEAAHAVGAGAGRGGRRAQVHPGDAGGVGVKRHPRSEDELPRRVGPRDDVPTDVVGVVDRHVRGRPHVCRDDAVPEAGGEPFDLPRDRLGGVTGPAVRRVGVGVDGVHVAVGPPGVGEGLLAEQDERALGHPAPVHRLLGRRRLLEVTDDVHGAGPAGGFVGPRHPTLDGVLDLERPRAVPVAPVRPGHPRRQPLAGHAHDRARRHVQHRQVRGAQLVQRLDVDTGLDRPTVRLDDRAHRRGDGLGPALGHRPAVAMCRRCQRRADGRRQRLAERAHRVRAGTGPQRPGLRGRHPRGQQLHRRGGPQPEPRQSERVGRDVQHRLEEVLGDPVEPVDQRPEQPSPRAAVDAEPVGRVVHGAVRRGAPPPVQRMAVLHLGPPPGQAMCGQVHRPAERGVHGQGVEAAALVVQQPGHRQLAAADPAADRVGGFQHPDRHAGGRQRDGGSQAVRPAAHHHCVGHRLRTWRVMPPPSHEPTGAPTRRPARSPRAAR